MKLFKGLGVLLTTGLLTFNVAFAHVSNENTIYDDTQNSNAKEELVYLRTLGVIPYAHGANVYMPQDLLSKSDLGHWAAQFVANDADKTPEDYIQYALDEKIIDSKEGNATYKEVAVAFFGEEALNDEDIQKALEGKEDSNITREEFALFLGEFVNRENGEGLFDRTNFEVGPNGKIEKVVAEEVTEDGSTYNVYSLTVNGKDVKVSGHPKVLNGSVELEQWEGKMLTESWMEVTADGEKEAVFLVLKDGEMKQETPAKAQDNQADEEKESFPWVLTGGIVLAILLVLVIVKSRKR